MKKNFLTWIFLLLVLLIFSIAAVSVFSFQLVRENRQLREQLDKAFSDCYLAVMYDLDSQRSMYRELGDLTAKAAQDPENVGFRAHLTGIIDGNQLSWSGLEADLYGVYTEMYSKDRDLAQSVRAFMKSIFYADGNKLNFADLSAAELEEISTLYSQLSVCFSRGDDNFGDLLINRKFETAEFQTAMEKLSGLMTLLNAYKAS